MEFVETAHPLSRPWKYVQFVGAVGGSPKNRICRGGSRHHPPLQTARIFRGGWGGEPPLQIIFQIIPEICLFQMGMQNTSKQCEIFTISMYYHVELEKNMKNTIQHV